MSNIALTLLAATVSVASLFARAQPSEIRAASTRQDYAIVQRASKMLAHTPRARVMTWLRGQSIVRSTSLGADGDTIAITLRDGTRSFILSSAPTRVAPRQAETARLTNPPTAASPAQTPRAVVLEPFATELHLGSNAGDAVAEELRSVGFHVDETYDENVTVQLMTEISRYDVVYMDTHSGVNQYGEGVVGTGQPANGDPAVEPYIKDGTVLVGGVAGSDQLYYGILSEFLVKHEEQFNPGSLAFINGCTLLLGTAFWDALQYRGIGALISWYDDVAPPSASVAAQLVFNDLIRHRTVQEAVANAPRQGYPMTNGTGGPAHLGYLGDPSLTLWPDSIAPTPVASDTPTLVPSATPTESSTASPLPRATPTSTEVWTCTWGKYRTSNHCRS